ncbi:Uncharacterized protein FWK35_00023065, partial [Aphis craccivora]
IAGINADIWKKISDNLSVDLIDKVTPGSVRSEPNIQDDPSSDESDYSSPKEKITFDITFSVEEWELTKPREKVYNEKKRGLRTYTMLTPYEWNKRLKSRTAEATTLLQNKDRLVELQIKCLEQEFEINIIKKTNVALKEKKMLLEIEVLEKKIKDSL